MKPVIFEDGWWEVLRPAYDVKTAAKSYYDTVVDHPPYYGGAADIYECIKVIEAWHLSFHLGNAVKYINRAGKKDKSKVIEDLKKARWYISREIERLGGNAYE